MHTLRNMWLGIVLGVSFFFCTNAFSITPPEKIIETLREKLLGAEEPLGITLKREVRRVPKQTIELEVFASMEADLDKVASIMTDFPAYPKWFLHSINKKPFGGSYRLQVLSLDTEEKKPSIMQARFFFDFPIIKREVERQLKLSHEQSAIGITIRGQTLDNPDSPIAYAQGILKTCRGEGLSGRVWLYVGGYVVIRNWFLYEAFPDSVLKNESLERVRIVLENYQAEEMKQITTRNQNPTEKTAETATEGLPSSRK